jgi:hypothetical protein
MKWTHADWDSAKCAVAYEDPEGRVRKANVKRHPDSVAEFLVPFESQRVTIGIEDGDSLWQRLWKNAGAKVFVFDGKKARRFSESLRSSGARDDKRAAKDLLEMVKSKRHREHANAPEVPTMRRSCRWTSRPRPRKWLSTRDAWCRSLSSTTPQVPQP